MEAILGQLLIVVALVALGSGGRALKIFSPEYSILLNNIATYFAIPALVFLNIQSSHEQAITPALLKVPIIAYLTILISGMVAFVSGRILKLPRKQMGVYLLTSMFGSTAFVGLPILTAVTGNKTQVQHSFYSELGSLVMLVTIGIVIASFYGEGSKFGWQNLLAIPRSGPFVAMVLALLFYDDTIPKPITDILRIISGSTLFIMMFSLGITIVWKDIRRHLVPVLAINFIKLILAPLIGLALARLLGVGPRETYVIVIDSATPSVIFCLGYAAQYKLDAEFASEAVFSSFFFCLLTIPFVSLFVPPFS